MPRYDHINLYDLAEVAEIDGCVVLFWDLDMVRIERRYELDRQVLVISNQLIMSSSEVVNLCHSAVQRRYVQME